MLTKHHHLTQLGLWPAALEIVAAMNGLICWMVKSHDKILRKFLSQQLAFYTMFSLLRGSVAIISVSKSIFTIKIYVNLPESPVNPVVIFSSIGQYS
jgi:hypothetical protein